MCELEVVNAFGLRVFPKQATPAEANSALNNFEGDLREGLFLLRGLPERIFEQARQLSQPTTAKLGTRTADLLRLAAALELGARFLYSCDQQQRKFARAVRLKLLTSRSSSRNGRETT
ncbi:MAG TPA: hypothetical protein VIX14_03980 [Terriglobales bacterium]